MLIQEFIEKYKAKTFMNTQQGLVEKAEWIRKEIEVKQYIPFMEKRQIANIIVTQNMDVIDGVKKYNTVDAYIGFIMSSITAHTNLECSANPISDYDLLAESGLLYQIVAEFQESHNEIDILTKMMVASELEDNQPGVIIGKFLDSILKKLDGAANTLQSMNLKDILSEKNMAKIIGFLNK